jgi:hypothetical protein
MVVYIGTNMSTGSAEEISFPDTQENLEDNARKVLTKQAALWLRIDGHLHRMLAALKHLAALTTRMENREHGSPPGPLDYEMRPRPGIYLDYSGHGPTPTREPSWQKAIVGVTGALVVVGIPSIFGVLWAMNSRLSDLRGDNKVIVQRLDQQDEHLKATDRQVEEIKRELWTRKH